MYTPEEELTDLRGVSEEMYVKQERKEGDSAWLGERTLAQGNRAEGQQRHSLKSEERSRDLHRKLPSGEVEVA